LFSQKLRFLFLRIFIFSASVDSWLSTPLLFKSR
jgi:hypothetical protein